MRYIGSKNKIAKTIVETIKQNTKLTNPTIIEPFVGSLSVTKELIQLPHKYYLASDIDEDLIILLDAIKKGYEPPDFLTEKQYEELKQTKEKSPLNSFAAFCCFAGKKWGGYPRSKADRNYYGELKRSLLKKKSILENIQLSHLDYINIENPQNCIIYADPPYINTTKNCSWKFNHDQFWDWARNISKNNEIYISECNAPKDFDILKTIDTMVMIRNSENKHDTRKEYVFVYNQNSIK